MTRTRFDDGGKTFAKSVGKVDDVIDVRPAASGAQQLEAESALWKLKLAMMEYRFVKSISFNELEDLYDLDDGSALHQNVNLLLANLLYSTRSAWIQANSDHDVFCEKDTQDSVRSLSKVMGPGVRDHTLCSDLIFLRCSKSLVGMRR